MFEEMQKKLGSGLSGILGCCIPIEISSAGAGCLFFWRQKRTSPCSSPITFPEVFSPASFFSSVLVFTPSCLQLRASLTACTDCTYCSSPPVRKQFCEVLSPASVFSSVLVCAPSCLQLRTSRTACTDCTYCSSPPVRKQFCEVLSPASFSLAFVAPCEAPFLPASCLLLLVLLLLLPLVLL